MPGWDEFLGDVTVVPGFQDGSHYGRVINFLLVIQFSTTGIACGVVVSDQIFVLSNPADDVTVQLKHQPITDWRIRLFLIWNAGSTDSRGA